MYLLDNYLGTLNKVSLFSTGVLPCVTPYYHYSALSISETTRSTPRPRPSEVFLSLTYATVCFIVYHTLASYHVNYILCCHYVACHVSGGFPLTTSHYRQSPRSLLWALLLAVYLATYSVKSGCSFARHAARPSSLDTRFMACTDTLEAI